VRAVVTGGAGFIGSHLVEALLARGDDVHVVDNLATGNRANVAEGATFHERDIREPLDDVFAQAQPETVFHLAAQADVGTSVAKPQLDAEVNVLGTLRLLEAARASGAQMVFSSTGGAIYGECERPAREDDPRQPLSPYGTSKLAGEEYLATWNRLHGMRNVALRLGNVFGPRQLAKLEGGVIAIFMERLASGSPVRIFGDGRQTRDFVYVGDVVDAALAAAGHRGGTYNVGTGRETSVAELHAACRAVSGSGEEPRFEPARLGDAQRSVLDVSRIERDLGWRARTTLEDGLRRTWEWTAAQAATAA
jgi:UDP-glucose 4-epimerase